MAENQINTKEPLRLAPRTRPPFAKALTLGLSLASGAMLGIAMPNLLTGGALMVGIKSLLLAGSATGVAYGVTRLAVEKGAPLTSIGYWPAAIASVASIGIVGGGLFAATYAGLTIDDVAELQLEEHGGALLTHVAAQNDVALEAQRLAPVASVIATDLSTKLTCEIRESCVSGRGAGGRGPVARAIDEKLGRAQAILTEVETGKAQRIAAQAALYDLLTEYQTAFADTDRTRAERRADLQTIDAEIRQKAGELAEALPVPLLAAYAEELDQGAVIAERPEATRRLSAILRGHGGSINAVLDGMSDAGAVPPAFPGKPGVSDTFAYVGHFAPIAAIVAVVELVFPLTLWLYTLLGLKWRAYRIAPPEQPRGDDDDDFFGGTPLSPASASLSASKSKRSRRRPNGRYGPPPS